MEKYLKFYSGPLGSLNASCITLNNRCSNPNLTISNEPQQSHISQTNEEWNEKRLIVNFKQSDNDRHKIIHRD